MTIRRHTLLLTLVAGFLFTGSALADPCNPCASANDGVAFEGEGPDVVAIHFFTVNVDDYAAGLEFYTTVLGLEQFMDEPLPGDDGRRWITVKAPNFDWPQIGLWIPEEGQPFPGMSTNSVLLQTFDCAALTAKVADAGGRVLQEPTEQYWGTEAVVTDLWGNTLVLTQYADFVLAPE